MALLATNYLTIGKLVGWSGTANYYYYYYYSDDDRLLCLLDLERETELGLHPN